MFYVSSTPFLFILLFKHLYLSSSFSSLFFIHFLKSLSFCFYTCHFYLLLLLHKYFFHSLHHFLLFQILPFLNFFSFLFILYFLYQRFLIIIALIFRLFLIFFFLLIENLNDFFSFSTNFLFLYLLNLIFFSLLFLSFAFFYIVVCFLFSPLVVFFLAPLELYRFFWMFLCLPAHHTLISVSLNFNYHQKINGYFSNYRLYSVFHLFLSTCCLLQERFFHFFIPLYIGKK